MAVISHFQKRRNPLRCQRISVSGLTIVNALRLEEAGESSQRKANGVGGPPRFYLSLDIEAELFAQKQILGGDSGW